MSGVMTLKRYPSQGGMTFGKIGARPLVKSWTARDYVQDGLVAMWDGIENAGWGVHDANATTWKDLVGVLDLNIQGNTWESNALSINGHTDWITRTGCSSLISTALNIELIAKVNGTSPSYYGRLLSWRYSYVTLGIYSLPNSQTSARFETYGYGATKDLSVSSLNQPHSFQYRYENGVGGSASIDYGSASGVSASIQSTSTIRITDTIALGAQSNGQDWTTFTCYGLRIYNRALTADEIAYNYAVDKLRFDLPTI